MDSPGSIVSPLKTSSDHPTPEKKEIELDSRGKDTKAREDEHLDDLYVYIHQARDIHNICIYQKQDVYAKLCLTTDPERPVSSKIIHGGGHNPVFNEGLRLRVPDPKSSLNCEIWMLSRVQSYMEDQLLGFALVPLSEVVFRGGSTFRKEFSLSSTDLFHSPAGFVELSISYSGAHPDLIPALAPVPTGPDNESIASLVNEFDRMEFPDPKVANENRQMVEEYIEICAKAEESRCGENRAGSQNVARPEESFKVISPPSEISTASAEGSYESSETTPEGPKAGAEEKSENGPVENVKMEVVQKDIVDMYMKSMQQFTDSLAKVKLPLDNENGPSSSENSTTSGQKTPPSSKNSGSRVFYGSRAFF